MTREKERNPPHGALAGLCGGGHGKPWPRSDSHPSTATDAHGAVEFIWVEMPDEYAPIRLRGASLFMNDMEDEVTDPWFFGEDAADMVVATGAQAQGLRPEVMHVLGARDGLGCLSQKMFTLERPAPAAPLAPPAWGLHGNDSDGNALEGDGMPWFGTADSTDVVMKANGVPQLRLGADGVTSVEGQLRLPNMSELVVDGSGLASMRLMALDAAGEVTALGGPLGGALDELLLEYNLSLQSCNSDHPIWYSGPNKLYVDCPEVLVGIGTDAPIASLDVRGDAVAQTVHTGYLRAGTEYDEFYEDLDAQAIVRGFPGPGRILEVQTSQGDAALRVFNSGQLMVGDGAFRVHPDGAVTVGPYLTEASTPATLYLGDDRNHSVRAHWGQGLRFGTYGVDNAMLIEDVTGKVGIGVGADHTFGEGLLEVNGTVRAKRFLAELTGWPDFVFHRAYALRPLSEVEDHIKAHGHLPDVPSAEQIEENGLDLGELIRIQMQKIEELTLYVIELEKKLNEKCGE